MLNYEDYQNAISSEKITLAIVTPAKRLVGWVLHSGFIYKLENFDISVIESIEDYGNELVSVGSIGAITAGTYYNDRQNSTLYLRTSDSVQPNTKFLVCLFNQYYSNVPVSLSHDLDSGYDVEWLPYIKSTSDFGVQLDNQNQLGFAIEGSGSLTFYNDSDYWKSRFDKWTWENKRVEIYSYNRNLPPSEAKIIFNGFISKKSWSLSAVSFSVKDVINELKNEFVLDNIEDYVGAIVPESLNLAKQRKVYGYVYGHVPTPIDQIVNGYYGTGSVDVTFESLTVSGTGTSFLTELSPGDDILVDGFDVAYTIDTIQSDTLLTVTEVWAEPTRNGKPFQIKPQNPKHYKNRVFLVAGHAIKEPVKTVVNAVSLNYLELSDVEDLRIGDKLQIGSEFTFVRRISGNSVKLTTNLVDLPSIGSNVTRLALSNVYLNGDTLFESDYSFDADTSILTLGELAEFNVASVQSLVGMSITFNMGSRSVTGIGTKFTSQLEPGMWVKVLNQVDWFEVLQVIDDTNLELRTAASYTDTDVGYFKAPEYYDEGRSVISVDCLGKTKDGTKTGVLIKTASEIVQDVLEDSGLGPYLETSSFDTAKILAPQLVGMVIPKRMSDKSTQKIRDVIGNISESVFGSLIQTNDFQLAYNILSPKRQLTDKKFTEKDLLEFSIESDSSKLIKTAQVNYLYKEYDYLALIGTNKQVSHTPNNNAYLQKSVLVSKFDSHLVLEDEAKTLAQRFALILQLSRATVKIKTKLQGARLSANERVWLSHEKLYERIGTNLNQKISAVESISKSGTNSNVEIDDLSGTFSRCGTITENTANDFDASGLNEKMINGFITDDWGMIDNDSETFGVNLIW